MHAARLKQHGRRCLPFSFEMVFSIRITRVSVFAVEFTQRIHSQRAIGVMAFHFSFTLSGASARATLMSCGTTGSGQSFVGVISILILPAVADFFWSESSNFMKCPQYPSGSKTVRNSWPLIVPTTATCPRDGIALLAVSGRRSRTCPRTVIGSAINATGAVASFIPFSIAK